MSKLFSKVRKDDKDKQADDNNTTPQQDTEVISAQMDAMMLQDFQTMQLDQMERLVIVGMFMSRCVRSVGDVLEEELYVLMMLYRYWNIWACVPGASQTYWQVLRYEDTQKDRGGTTETS